MGTKNNPGKWDCYANAEPDEPMFTFLGRDEDGPDLVDRWAAKREAKGEIEVATEARACAEAMREWRRKKREGGR